MPNQNAIITAFLAHTPWAAWEQNALAGDASTRRYVRLTQGGESVILMDASSADTQSTEAFARIAAWLRNQRLASPEVLKADVARGLLLLEDLGPSHLSAYSERHPTDTPHLYTAATDVLIHLNDTPPPAGLHAMTPGVGGQMLEVTLEWYAGDARDQSLITEVSSHLERLCEPPTQIALRDYHAENLIWRPDRAGLDRIGVLDFQDAFLAPRGYDLISLLRDVRREVGQDIASEVTARFTKATGPFAPGALNCLAVQRNLRILGVFARLAKRDGKRRYMRMIPRVWDLILQDLTHPALTALKNAAATCLPPPEHSAIKDLL